MNWKKIRVTDFDIILALCAALAFLLGGPDFGLAGEPGAKTGIRFSAAAANKVSPWLMDNLHTADSNGFIVVLGNNADLSAPGRYPSKQDRARHVFSALRSAAESGQAPFREWLDSKGIQYKPFYIVNAIFVETGSEHLPAIAARPDVLRIEGNPNVRGVSPVTPEADIRIDAPSAMETVEWGVAKIRAPEVWTTHNITGTGIVVAGNDTGVQWDHPALKAQYRGWNGSAANHNYNWHDAVHGSGSNPCGYDTTAPCDDYGHGTHTIGTAVGDDGGSNRIGVAPGAKWIGCRNMDQGYGSPARYIECFEFFLAPYPIGGDSSAGDPSKAPHVINNSWGCPASEGCSADTLRASVEALRAAGIEMIVSAGNTGSACATVSDPPSFYEASFAVGATDSSDNIASFSSRGPATADGSDRLKPDMSAPGYNVRSAYTGNSYQTLSGTSMAAPHLAGAVALLWSGAPVFRGKVCETEMLFTGNAHGLTSAQDCGGVPGAQIPNNTFGWGRLDALSAVETALVTGLPHTTLRIFLTGSGSGRVTSAPSGIDCGSSCTVEHSLCESPTVTLTAVANSGSVFAGWSGETCSGTAPSCTVDMTGDISVTANFVPAGTRRFALSVVRTRKSGGDGSISTPDSGINCGPGATACRNSYYKGTPVTLSAAAVTDSTFTGWKPTALCPDKGDCTVTMDRSRSVQAVFVGPQKLTVTKQKVKKGDGRVASTPGGIDCGAGCSRASWLYPLDRQVTLSASPDAGSAFTGWRPTTLCPDKGDCTVTMDKARSVTAVFTKAASLAEEQD